MLAQLIAVIKNQSHANLLTPQWAAPNNVVAVTTTRANGFSEDPYGSFNLGDHVGDTLSSVRQNRQQLSDQLGLPNEPVWLEQTHSTKVIALDNSRIEKSLADRPAADGAITYCVGQVCAIMTADCMPLFLTNKSGTKVGLLHAGWRGMADGIIEKGVAKLNEDPMDILAWAGPTISGQFFEVGAGVKEQLAGPDSAYRNSDNTDKYFADLYQLAAARLNAIGVNNFGHSEYCTFQQADLFYSYRRDGVTGRMASLIYFT